jgi:hypothetical protein
MEPLGTMLFLFHRITQACESIAYMRAILPPGGGKSREAG